MLRCMERNGKAEPEIPPFIRKLMPGATEGELRDAREAVCEYLKAVLGIWEERKGNCGELDSRSEEARSTIPSPPEGV